ncbi:hypothetical protein M970_090060 [Encephalitozoon cuniculi EcunIII-L]|uniref:GPI-anchored wall transfer protein n=1 Tax=Encephalitozoon cuniculi TaxID=6035 RepID=M1KAH3_ENCCN|nr:hypothetical protein ECU09_0060 [Encephalitozoon cuniculi]KMV65485.1 hypothetical protein M970_090060 [Encephalitozoon cuniculi EcunIII-L]UYI26683.1 membrane protein [Encephalitozoon cuniculi]
MTNSTLSEIELFAATSITHLSILVYHLMLPKSTLLEFMFSAVPLYSVIVFLKYSGLVYALFLVVLGVYFLFVRLKKWRRLREPVWPGNPSSYPKQSVDAPQDDEPYTSMAIDRTRFLIIGCVVIAIFASDFPFYKENAKLGKSMGYGLKLMDIGVGSFVYNAGFFSTRADPQRKMKNALSSFFFGMLRYLSKELLKLDVDDREFGVHLNFFLMLGVLNLASLVINTRANFLLGFGMCLTHELFLKFFGLEKLIYSSARSSIITSNIEGITFLLPQMGMFLMAADISKVVFKKKNLSIIILYNAFFVAVLSIARVYSTSCRRIHNLYFCMVIMLLHTTHGIVFEVFSRTFKIRNLEMHRFISKYLLFILVWSNMLVTLNKLLSASKDMSRWSSHALCITYLVLVFYVPCAINSKVAGKLQVS